MAISRFIFCFFILLPIVIKAQLPQTDVFLAEFKNIHTQAQLSSLKYLSGFNSGGYNNQAKFLNYDEVFLSIAKDTSKTTDIFALNIKDSTMYQVTDTEKISEFSPTIVPSSNQFSVVRIEADGIDQSLWVYPLDRSSKGQRLLPDLKNIGYHCWLNKDTIALYLLGTPNTLAIANTKNEEVQTITQNIGRCIKISPDGHVLFVHKLEDTLWLLKQYHVKDKAISTISTMPSGIEDFEISINGTIFVGVGAQIKSTSLQKPTYWKTVFDFAPYGIEKITRPALIRERMIFVSTNHLKSIK